MYLKLTLSIILIILSITLALAGEKGKNPYRYTDKYTINDIMSDPEKAKAFEEDYIKGESYYFSIARDKKTYLIYDGYNLKEDGTVKNERYWSAPSKESLDVAICVKAIEGNKKAALLIAGGNVEKSKEIAVNILEKKLEAYLNYYHENPGYGGFIPWIYIRDKVTPAPDWVGQVPGLDNGEWIWSILAAEQVLRKEGYKELADKYLDYINLLRNNVVKMFYDEKEKKVRGDVDIVNPQSYNSEYKTTKTKCTYLTGEHGVHEGMMMVMFVTLFGKGLPEDAKEAIWKATAMKRVETEYGTTWQGFWGSSHESWAYLFLPLRDFPEYKKLFRIREIIRTENASHRGYPGLVASINEPGGDGYLSAGGIERVGSQEIKHNHVFAPYGAFPLLLEFSDTYKGNYGFAWLLNMLKANKMIGPLGGGESGTNDGRYISHMKTVDGSLTNILAIMGGLEKETAQMLKHYGLYDEFKEIMLGEYNETFKEPLKEPAGFAIPSVSVPLDKSQDYGE